MTSLTAFCQTPLNLRYHITERTGHIQDSIEYPQIRSRNLDTY